MAFDSCRPDSRPGLNLAYRGLYKGFRYYFHSEFRRLVAELGSEALIIVLHNLRCCAGIIVDADIINQTVPIISVPSANIKI